MGLGQRAFFNSIVTRVIEGVEGEIPHAPEYLTIHD